MITNELFSALSPFPYANLGSRPAFYLKLVNGIPEPNFTNTNLYNQQKETPRDESSVFFPCFTFISNNLNLKDVKLRILTRMSISSLLQNGDLWIIIIAAN